MWNKTHDRILIAARLFNDESDMHPTHTIAREFNATTRTAERLVKRAREMGLITRTTRTGNTMRPLEHGTIHGYELHRCRCQDCRSANAARAADLRRRRASRRDTATFTHGQYGYTNWGCRCDVCSAAHSARCKSDYRKRLARQAVR